jgi:hypothetical protein
MDSLRIFAPALFRAPSQTYLPNNSTSHQH